MNTSVPRSVLLSLSLFAFLACGLLGCSVVKAPYYVTKGALKGTYLVTKYAVKGGVGAGTVVYHVGRFTFKVAKAPIEWPLVREDIESIDDMPPKKAIEQDRVKNSPYTVHGKRYEPMSVARAKDYRERGTASWYGEETRRQAGGHMTANGEVFDPDELTAAHKHLPLPTYVRVSNLENGRSIIVRVNDRGPFKKGRIIDLSAGAARRLGFYEKGTTTVQVKTVPTREG